MSDVSKWQCMFSHLKLCISIMACSAWIFRIIFVHFKNSNTQWQSLYFSVPYEYVRKSNTRAPEHKSEWCTTHTICSHIVTNLNVIFMACNIPQYVYYMEYAMCMCIRTTASKDQRVFTFEFTEWIISWQLIRVGLMESTGST